jgi:hypothetical protein
MTDHLRGQASASSHIRYILDDALVLLIVMQTLQVLDRHLTLQIKHHA